MNNGLFSPIMTDTEPGPQDLWCDAIAKNPCDKGCYSRKAGLKCSSLCGICLGVFCDNAVDEQNTDDENGDYFSDMNFLDAFN